MRNESEVGIAGREQGARGDGGDGLRIAANPSVATAPSGTGRRTAIDEHRRDAGTDGFAHFVGKEGVLPDHDSVRVQKLH